MFACQSTFRYARAALFALCGPFAIAVLLAMTVASGAQFVSRQSVVAVAGVPTMGASAAVVPTPAPVLRGKVVLTQGSFTDELMRPDFWERRKSGNAAGSGNATAPTEVSAPPSLPPGQSGGPQSFSPQKSREIAGDGSERTVCVRLCDGFYWPISYPASPSTYDQDEETCQASCLAPSRLFVIKSGDADVGEMKDLDGRPYAKLEKAFAYRSSYNAECKCKPHPWEQASRDMHRVFALVEPQGKPSKEVVAEVAALTQSVAKAMPPVIKKVVASYQPSSKGWDNRAIASSSGRKVSRTATARAPVLDEDGVPLERVATGKSSSPEPWANQKMGLGTQANKGGAKPSSGGSGGSGVRTGWQRSAFAGN